MTDQEIKQLVTDGARLAAEIAPLEAKAKELEAIKKQLREAAGDADATFVGLNGETAEVKQQRDGIGRSFKGDLVPRILKLAGEKVWDFFQLAPIPGKELPQKDLRVQLLTDLHKAKATALIETITVASTARVTFGKAAA
jgi:hypothetical protein